MVNPFFLHLLTGNGNVTEMGQHQPRHRGVAWSLDGDVQFIADLGQVGVTRHEVGILRLP